MPHRCFNELELVSQRNTKVLAEAERFKKTLVGSRRELLSPVPQQDAFAACKDRFSAIGMPGMHGVGVGFGLCYLKRGKDVLVSLFVGVTEVQETWRLSTSPRPFIQSPRN